MARKFGEFYDHVSSQPWAPAYLRELEATLIANIMIEQDLARSLPTLLPRMAGRLMSLDGGYDENFIETSGRPIHEVFDLLEGSGRGTWTISGDSSYGYAAYMADGRDGFASTGPRTENPESFLLSPIHAYGSLLEDTARRMFPEILKEMVRLALFDAGIVPGTVMRDVMIGSTHATTAEYLGTEQSDGETRHSIRYRERGKRKEVRCMTPALGLLRISGVPLAPPLHHDPAEDHLRVQGLSSSSDKPTSPRI